MTSFAEREKKRRESYRKRVDENREWRIRRPRPLRDLLLALAKVLHYNDLTIKEVETAMRGENISLPAGTLEADNIDLTLNLDKSYTDIKSIKQLPIKKTGNK